MPNRRGYGNSASRLTESVILVNGSWRFILLGAATLLTAPVGCSEAKGREEHREARPMGGEAGEAGETNRSSHTGGGMTVGGAGATGSLALGIGGTLADSFSSPALTGGSGGASNNGGASNTQPQAPVYCNELPAPTLEALLSDPELRGKKLSPEFVSYSFSQSTPSAIDSQLDVMAPTVSIRTTNQWGKVGTSTSEYDTAGIKRLKEAGTRVILGLTASVIFENQFASRMEFLDAVTRDAMNNPVLHKEIVPNAYRGNVASPRFRDLVVANAKTLIDVGADGIFFDEANAGYTGAKFDGNEGFDEYHELDFRRYLCAQFPGTSPAGYSERFGFSQANPLDCSAKLCTRSGFSFRTYLTENGVAKNLARVDPRVAAVWGQPIANRCVPSPKSFTETYNTIYWADIVRRVRKYARDTYGREILITSNGLFPFVDFQSVGLYPYNVDADSGTSKEVQYVPTDAIGKLAGSVSLLPVFARLRTQSEALEGDVPVVLFVDWPTRMSAAYYAFSEQEKKDYFRIYGAEAYAAGLRFAWHLKTSMPDEPSATKSGMLDWFAKEADFYRTHSEYFIGARPATAAVTLGANNVTTALSVLPNGKRVVHLINHEYSGGLVARSELAVEVNTPSAATEAKVISPDGADATAVPLVCDASVCRFTLPTLRSYTMVVID